ncbi:MAG TPA: hypothetical protein VFB78_18890 [Acidimicrobiales bacterium]|nr:hypothetical protein [Acidimicrobiales bacterium]
MTTPPSAEELATEMSEEAVRFIEFAHTQGVDLHFDVVSMSHAQALAQDMRAVLADREKRLRLAQWLGAYLGEVIRQAVPNSAWVWSPVFDTPAVQAARGAVHPMAQAVRFVIDEADEGLEIYVATALATLGGRSA